MANKLPPEITIDEYVKTARSTAIYKDRFVYPALGLADESGELLDKIFPQSGSRVAPMTLEVMKEMGDVLWYIVNTCLDIELPFSAIVETATNGLECRTFGDVCFQRLKPRDRRSPYMKLTTYAGRVAGVAKKTLRDTGGTLPAPKRAVVVDALTQMLVALCELCDRFGICLSDIAQLNADKLTDRKERGKIKGDGDDR